MIHQWLTFLAAPSLIQICFGVWIKNHKLNKIRCINTCQNISRHSVELKAWVAKIINLSIFVFSVQFTVVIKLRISNLVKCVKSSSYFVARGKILKKVPTLNIFPSQQKLRKNLHVFFILKFLHLKFFVI